MDESRRKGPSGWRVLAIPFVVLLMVPLAILMALAYYVRAFVFGVGQMLGMSSETPTGLQPLQGPHFSDTSHRISQIDGGHSDRIL
jgi:hypothetical protein